MWHPEYLSKQNMLESLLRLIAELGGMRQHLRRLESDAKGTLNGGEFWKAVDENEKRIEWAIGEVKKLTPNA